MKMAMLRLAVGVMAMAVIGAMGWAQTSGSPLAPPANGVRQTQAVGGLIALTGATVHIAPGRLVENATLVVRDGKIVSVASEAAPPAGAPVRDLRGMHVYAGFIEPMVQVNVPAPDPGAPGSHWSTRVTPQRGAMMSGAAGIDAKELRELREMGFVAAAISPKGGIFRGSGAVVSLAEKPSDPSLRQPTVYRERAFNAVSFETSREEEGGTQGRGPGDDPKWSRYPDSQMGAIAVIRQTLSDADWKQNAARSGADPTDALDALRRVQTEGGAHDSGTLLFDVDDELEVLRAAKIANEFKRPAVVFGSGMEFRRLDAIKASGVRLIVPLAALDAPKVATLGERESVELRELMNWELAPTNAARLDAAGISVAISSAKIPEKRGGRKAFQERLSNAIKHGLSAERALAMLTVNPAEMLGVSDRLGTIEPGKAASFVVADGPLFADRPDAPGRGEPGYVRGGRIVDVWIDGSRQPVGERRRYDLSGTWSVELTPAPPGNDTRTIEINDAWPPEVTMTKLAAGENEPVKVKAAEVRLSGDADGGEPSRISWVFQHEAFGSPGVFAVDGVIERGGDGVLILRGRLTRAGGETAALVARRAGNVAADSADALRGTWTELDGGKPRNPSDARFAHVVINPDADKKVRVKKGEKELESELLEFEPGSEGKPTRIGVKVRGFVEGASEVMTEISLTPEQEVIQAGDRLGGLIDFDSVRMNDVPADFGRYRPTPEADAIAQIPAKLALPIGPYGFEQLPNQGTFIIRSATVWTLADAGTLKDAGVVISGGKIAAVGDSTAITDWLSRVKLSEPPVEIDATGKHVAPGIIDCHSHTGISKGVNEGGQSVTSEVRIGDVTDPDSISWYRQLAGGVTAVNNLHGSANTIGGQNQVNKIRWGCAAPDDMHFEGAIAGIKFALGENVKQSNWGDRFNTRYPQTRMGVEMLLRDRFTAAREYMQARATDAGKNAVRRDLELDALAEILRGERLVHCHSYRQDEILMLCRVAKEFGFLIGTFQHGLEVYKVADEVKAAAIGASLFSDWWTFKVEVQDAIPMAGPLQHELGLTTSFNSDSDELARRMNVEAGKAIKYSGGNGVKMSPEDALKFVTLNPAKQLRVDDRVGTIELGKDADLAIWSGPPMSSLSRCERTFVDGREMFSLDMDRSLREKNAKERARIIQKLLTAAAPAKGEEDKTRGAESEVEDTPKSPPSAHQPWDMRSGRRSLLADMYTGAADRRREHFVNMLRRGLDPRFHGAGVCGCENW